MSKRVRGSAPRRGGSRIVAAAAALGIALAGCGTVPSAAPGSTTTSHTATSTSTDATASSSATPAVAAATQITYWAGHASGALHAAVVAEVAQFNATHPSIHVTFDTTGATTHGLAAFEAGDPPNVGMISRSGLQQMVAAGALVNLESYIHGPNGLTTAQIQSDYYPAVWADMQTGNAQYMMPLEKKALTVIHYNETLFSRAGISGAPTTWQQFATDAQKITALGAGYHGVAWTPNLRQFFDMTISNGGQVFTTQTSRQAFSLGTRGR